MQWKHGPKPTLTTATPLLSDPCLCVSVCGHGACLCVSVCGHCVCLCVDMVRVCLCPCVDIVCVCVDMVCGHGVCLCVDALSTPAVTADTLDLFAFP